MDDALRQTLDKFADSLRVLSKEPPAAEHLLGPDWITCAIEQRAEILAASVKHTVRKCAQIDALVRLFLRWMQEATVVRVIGAGRARLAAAIPANRLAHGGARVFVQNDIIPMPHTVKGGAVIAASASGRTSSVLEILRIIREEAPQITVVGIAKADAHTFRDLCHHFIGIEQDQSHSNPLVALADIGEYVISEVLDALVVAAGKLGGFDERMWRLGHENVGDTGPYDARIRADLLFNERY